MAIYLYRAIAIETQKKVRGEIEAEDEQSVRQWLIAKDLYPKEIQKKNLLNTEIHIKRSHVSLREISFLCRQLAALIQAGISISEALSICKIQAPNKLMKQHIKSVHDKVEAGKMFSEAIREEKIFPLLLVSLVACGERTGHLDEVLKRASEYFDHQIRTRSKVKKALTYPTFVMGLVIVVIAIMMIYVVPGYVSLLKETGGQLPLPTKVIIAMSEFMVDYYPMIFLGCVSILGLVIGLMRIEGVKQKWESIKLLLPIIGKLEKQRLVVQFSSTMFLLIHSEIDVLQALEMTIYVMNHSVATGEIQYAIERLRQGNRLGASLEKSRLFPAVLVSMISVGEESGALGELLEKSSCYFNEEMNHTIDTLVTLIEPIMIIMVALMIGGIMAAIVLPTFSAATAAM